MPGLDWVFRLRDQVSPAASSMEKQLRQLSGAMKALDLAAKQQRLATVADPLRKQRLELQIQRDKLLLGKRALDEHSRASTAASKAWTESLVRWGASLYILDSIGRAFRTVGRAAVEMGGQVRDAIESRQRGLFGLRSNLGDQQGSALFGHLQRQALAYGRPAGEVVNLGSSFTDFGASPALASHLVAAREDIRARTGGRVDIAEQIRTILSSPVVDVGNVEAFRGAFPLKKLWAALGQQIGKRPGDAEQSLRMHGIPGGAGSDLLVALQNTVAGLNGQRGLLGTSAVGFANRTLEGAIGRVQTAWEQLLGSLERSKGFKTLRDVLQNLASALGGRPIRNAFTDLADTLGKALDPLTGAAGKKRMEDFFTSMSKQVAGVLPGLQKLVEFGGKIAGWGLKSIEGYGMLGDLKLGDFRFQPPAEGAALTPEARERINRTNPFGLLNAPPTVRGMPVTRPQITVHAPVSMRIEHVTADNPEELKRTFTQVLTQTFEETFGNKLADTFDKWTHETGAGPVKGD